MEYCKKDNMQEDNMQEDLIEAFNKHILEFIRDLQKVYPRDVDIQITKTAAHAATLLNPTVMIKSWRDTVVRPYREEIEKGEINFFIDKDYKDDLKYLDNDKKAQRIMQGINNLRAPIKKMNSINKAKSMKYVQNLTKLAELYK